MKELRIPGNPEVQRKASITVDADTAVIVRKIAVAEGRAKNMTAVLNDMIKAYLAAEHPDWSLHENVRANRR